MVTKVLSWHPDRLGKSAPRHPGPTKNQRSGTHRRSPPHNLLALISRQHEPVEMCPFFSRCQGTKHQFNNYIIPSIWDRSKLIGLFGVTNHHLSIWDIINQLYHIISHPIAYFLTGFLAAKGFRSVTLWPRGRRYGKPASRFKSRLENLVLLMFKYLYIECTACM